MSARTRTLNARCFASDLPTCVSLLRALLLQRLASWWVIDPRVSKVLGTWDIVCVFALIFVALVTPFEVAFLESPRDAADLYWRFGSVGWLWCTNRIVDLLFTLDLFLQFRLMYQTSDDSVNGAHAREGSTRALACVYAVSCTPLLLHLLTSRLHLLPLHLTPPPPSLYPIPRRVAPAG